MYTHNLNIPAVFVIAFDRAKADETPFPLPDISSPRSSFANLSFISSVSESRIKRHQRLRFQINQYTCTPKESRKESRIGNAFYLMIAHLWHCKWLGPSSLGFKARGFQKSNRPRKRKIREGNLRKEKESRRNNYGFRDSGINVLLRSNG